MRKRTFDWHGVEYQSPEYYRLWREANPKYRVYKRSYDRKMYRKYLERELSRRKRWQDANKEKVSAQRKLNYAVKTGKLKRGQCQATNCYRFKTVGHHYDYNKPLDVMWLCELHHKQWHRENKVIEYATA